MEVCKNFDCLLNDDVFLNMGCEDRINMGCGFGSVPGHSLMKTLLNIFESDKNVIVNGKFNRRPCNSYVNPVVMEYGLEIKNMYQNIEGVVLYPSEVMSPLTIGGFIDNMTEKTCSIHKEDGAWKTNTERCAAKQLIQLIKNRTLIREVKIKLKNTAV